MAYVDPQSIQDPATGVVASAAWADTVRDDLEFLYNKPMCTISAGGTTAITTATLTVLPESIENYDTDGMHTSSDDFMTVNTAGRYLMFATVTWDGDVAGAQRYSEIYLPDTAERFELAQGPPCPDADDATTQSGCRSHKFFGGERAQVRVRHDAGHNVPCIMNEFSLQWVGP